MDKRINIQNKVFYQSVKFLFKYLKKDINHERYKKLWFDKDTHNDDSEKNVKSYIKSFQYLITNLSVGITNTLIKDSYFLLTGSRLSEKKVNEILISYYSQKEESAHLCATMIHKICYKVIKIKKVEYAMLLTNYVLLRKGYSIITLFKSEIKKYKEALSYLEKDWTYLYGFIVANELHIRKNNLKIFNMPLKYTKQEFMIELSKHKDELVKNFKIKHIYLYGSLSTNQSNISSDVDLLIIMEKKGLEYFQKMQKISSCKQYLEKHLEARVDLIDITSAIKLFGTRGIEQAIKIY